MGLIWTWPCFKDLGSIVQHGYFFFVGLSPLLPSLDVKFSLLLLIIHTFFFSFWTYIVLTELKCSDLQILHWSFWHILAMQCKSYWFRIRRCWQFSARTIQQGIHALTMGCFLIFYSAYNSKIILSWDWKVEKGVKTLKWGEFVPRNLCRIGGEDWKLTLTPLQISYLRGNTIQTIFYLK